MYFNLSNGSILSVGVANLYNSAKFAPSPRRGPNKIFSRPSGLPWAPFIFCASSRWLKEVEEGQKTGNQQPPSWMDPAVRVPFKRLHTRVNLIESPFETCSTRCCIYVSLGGCCGWKNEDLGGEGFAKMRGGSDRVGVVVC